MQQTGVEISYMDYLRTHLTGEPMGKVTPPDQVSFNELLKSNFHWQPDCHGQQQGRRLDPISQDRA